MYVVPYICIITKQQANDDRYRRSLLFRYLLNTYIKPALQNAAYQFFNIFHIMFIHIPRLIAGMKNLLPLH